MKRKVLSAMAVGLGLCLATSSHAILMDLTGQGGAAADSFVIDFETLDWGVSGALVQGGIPVTEGGSHTVYTHATLSSFKSQGTNVDISGFGVLDTDFEITVVLGFGETTNSVSPDGTLATFAYDSTNPVNFFEIYIDDVDADLSLNAAGADLTSGVGFNDGTLLLSGKVSDANGVFFVTSGDTPIVLDQFGADDLSGQLSVGGTGSTSMEASVANVNINHNYFLEMPANLSFVLNDTSNNALPFLQVDPQTNFWDGGAYLSMGPGFNIGPVNGVFGPDMMLQTDGSTVINVIPEPGTMLLLGSGLLGLAGVSRRRVK